MKDYGIPPSIVTYASLLDGLCRSVRLDEAVSLLEDMEDHILMDSLCESGRLEDVAAFLLRSVIERSAT